MSAPFNYAAFYQKKAAAAARDVANSAAEYERNPNTETSIRLKMDLDNWAFYDAARRAAECHGL